MANNMLPSDVVERTSQHGISSNLKCIAYNHCLIIFQIFSFKVEDINWYTIAHGRNLSLGQCTGKARLEKKYILSARNKVSGM